MNHEIVIRFASKAHRDFFMEMREKTRYDDNCRRAFFYVMGLTEETRANISRMYDFEREQICPEGMRGGWQTSGSVRVCRMAFNLFNGYVEKKNCQAYTPEDLFCCEFSSCFMEGIKLRYPDYYRELAPAKKAPDRAR